MTHYVREVYASHHHHHQPVEFWRLPMSSNKSRETTPYFDHSTTQRAVPRPLHGALPTAVERVCGGLGCHQLRLDSTGFSGGDRGKGDQVRDYHNLVLVPIVRPAFNSLPDDKGVQEPGLYVEAQVPAHGTEKTARSEGGIGYSAT